MFWRIFTFLNPQFSIYLPAKKFSDPHWIITASAGSEFSKIYISKEKEPLQLQQLFSLYSTDFICRANRFPHDPLVYSSNIQIFKTSYFLISIGFVEVFRSV